MKILTILAFACSLLSIRISLWLVLSNPAARGQLVSLEFPLSEIGEAAFGMIIPLALIGCGYSYKLFHLEGSTRAGCWWYRSRKLVCDLACVGKAGS